MKHTISSVAGRLSLALGLLAPLAAEPLVIRDVVTHDELAERLRVATNQGPTSQFKPSTGVDPTTVNKPKDIVSSSDFLSFGGKATLVPKRAILHIPPQHAGRIKLQPGSTIQTWAEFYAANRAWITTVEVSRNQARGVEPFAEELSQRIQKSGNVIVATYKTGPISVLPPKAPVPAATGAPATTLNSTKKP
jgi:hypothetical protein